MKRTLFAAAAALLIAAPVAAPAFAQQGHNNPPAREEQQGRHDDDEGRGDHDSSHDHRANWRDARGDARWDTSVHNGYYVRNSWHSGRPPASAYRKSGFQLGYQPWRKGDRLGDFRQRYVEVDYRTAHLPRPHRGQHYVRDDNTGDILLAAIATGLIISILTH